MLYLSSNTTNIIYTSVSVHKTLSNPTYLMSLTHQQTGKRWSFIPQNITSISGTPYNNRYDLFKFNIAESGVNLTGGTKGWYWQTPPSTVYSDSRYSGTSKSYLRINPIVVNNGFYQVIRDFSNTSETITGGTMTLNGISLTSISVGNFNNIEANSWYILGNSQGDNSGLLQVIMKTNLGNTISESYYVTSIQNAYNEQPWTYYGYSSVGQLTEINLPITYIDTPTVNIDEIGEFRYSIREQINPVNLNPQFTTEVLETGIAYMYQGFDDIYYDKGGDDVVYNPSETQTYHILQENEYHILTEDNNLLRQE